MKLYEARRVGSRGALDIARATSSPIIIIVIIIGVRPHLDADMEAT